MDEKNIYLLILILVIIPIIVIIFNYIRDREIGKKIAKKKQDIKEDKDIIDEIINATGYSYDKYQDIFYSNLDAWQREMGYCRLYDEAASAMGMIIDCEPIHFEYGGKRWLIEFWKGQYDLVTGGEIGIYTTKKADLEIPGIFKGAFYDAADDTDLLNMSFSLIKNNKVLFRRKAMHWWLTGFKLGEFSEPYELSMILKITFKDIAMRNAFLKALKEVGYTRDKFKVIGKSVRIIFDKPYTKQPITRTPQTDWIIQRKNQLLCEKYIEITKPFDNLEDKINAIKEKAPDLYGHILNIGKTKHWFAKYNKIKEFL